MQSEETRVVIGLENVQGQPDVPQHSSDAEELNSTELSYGLIHRDLPPPDDGRQEKQILLPSFRVVTSRRFFGLNF